VTLDFRRSRKSTDNAFVKSFSGRLRDEYLNAYWLLSITDARTRLEARRRGYSESCLHTSLGRMTLVEYAATASRWPLNERRKLTFKLYGKPGDP